MKIKTMTLLAVAAFASLQPQAQAQAIVDLGSAASFAVLAGTSVTNSGLTIVNGDLGVSPGATVVGFGPGVVNGTIHQNDSFAVNAQVALTAAYNDAAGRIPTTLLGAAYDLGGNTLMPGVYNSTSSFAINGILTLDADGDSNAVWIFQAGSTLITGIGSQVLLTGSAQASNIFWQVGSSATFNTSSYLAGNVLALTGITLGTGAIVDGRLLARTAGAVTLNGNTITAIPEPSVTSLLIAGLLGLVIGVRRIRRQRC